MKTNLLGIVLIFLCLISYGQSKMETSKAILPNAAFDRMIIQDVTYAIFGETNPISGIKLDISKPEATISGVFNLNKQGSVLLGIDFKGGVTDKNFSIFKGTNSFNTAFELRPSIHIIPAWSWANYDLPTTIVDAKIELLERAVQSQMDTFEMAKVIYNYHLRNFPESIESSAIDTSAISDVQKQILVSLANKLTKTDQLQFSIDEQFRELITAYVDLVDTVQVSESEREVLLSVRAMLPTGRQRRFAVSGRFTQLFDAFVTVSQKANLIPPQRQVLLALITRLGKRDRFQFSADDPFSKILDGIGVVSTVGNAIDVNTYKDDVVSMYQKQKKTQGDDKVKLDKQIRIASDAWTSKQYFWISITPFARAEKLNLYRTRYEDKDSSYFKPDYPFFYGAGISLNMLRLYPARLVHYGKISINMAHANNISTLNSFNYETRTSFFNYGNVITEKNKTGTAYNHSDIKTDFLVQTGFEYFLLPIKKFLPGLYISGNLNFSSLYRLKTVKNRGNDKIQIPLEGGVVFNINNREKDKSLLSILMYTRFEDVTDRRRTSVADEKKESKEDHQKRNLSFGIKVGIPITLPQRK